jgi:hypothetical protein
MPRSRSNERTMPSLLRITNNPYRRITSFAVESNTSVRAVPVDGWRSALSDPQSRSRAILYIGTDVISLYRRCGFLREHGWLVISSTAGHGGICSVHRRTRGCCSARCGGRRSGNGSDRQGVEANQGESACHSACRRGPTLVERAVDCADAVVPTVDESELLKALEKRQTAEPA